MMDSIPPHLCNDVDPMVIKSNGTESLLPSSSFHIVHQNSTQHKWWSALVVLASNQSPRFYFEQWQVNPPNIWFPQPIRPSETLWHIGGSEGGRLGTLGNKEGLEDAGWLMVHKLREVGVRNRIWRSERRLGEAWLEQPSTYQWLEQPLTYPGLQASSELDEVGWDAYGVWVVLDFLTDFRSR